MEFEMEEAHSTFTNPGSKSLSASNETSMNHTSLTLRPNANVSQPFTALSSRQENLGTTIDLSTNSDVNAPTSDISSQVATFQRMMAQAQALAIKQKLLDTGYQSAEDIEYFFEHLHYPARDIADVRIMVGYSVRGRGEDPMWAVVTRCHPASNCTTFPDLMNATKSDWDDVFLDLNLIPLVQGVQPRDLIVWSKRTHGGHECDWIEAPGLGDYTKWFRDYVVHGRSAVLCVFMRYKGPIKEQTTRSTKGGTSFICDRPPRMMMTSRRQLKMELN